VQKEFWRGGSDEKERGSTLLLRPKKGAALSTPKKKGDREEEIPQEIIGRGGGNRGRKGFLYNPSFNKNEPEAGNFFDRKNRGMKKNGGDIAGWEGLIKNGFSNKSKS